MTHSRNTGPRILVSGGAGGLGQAVCRRLSAVGLTPVISFARNRERALALARETGGEPLALDLCDANSIDAALGWIGKGEEPLLGVVLAASRPPVLAPFGRIDEVELRRQLEVCAVGPRRLLAGLVKHHFRKQKQGSVVAVLSSAMGRGLEGATSSMGAYVIAKHAMEGMLALLAADYPWLHVCAVRPGFVDTDMLKAFDARFLHILRERNAIATPEAIAMEVCASLLKGNLKSREGAL